MHKKFYNVWQPIIRDINWIQINNYYLCMKWVYNLLVRGFDMSKVVHSLPKTINFWEIQILVGTQQCRSRVTIFFFRKVIWPLPLRRGEWMGFKLTAKLTLSVTKPNCRRTLKFFGNLWDNSHTWFQCQVPPKTLSQWFSLFFFFLIYFAFYVINNDWNF